MTTRFLEIILHCLFVARTHNEGDEQEGEVKEEEEEEEEGVRIRVSLAGMWFSLSLPGFRPSALLTHTRQSCC